LPDKQRATLILRAYHDMSHQEIADVLGSSVGAVKANFFHALANLKKILGSEP
jgi:RNA polymerase sigma-70 factor (ECF subfamily)